MKAHAKDAVSRANIEKEDIARAMKARPELEGLLAKREDVRVREVELMQSALKLERQLNETQHFFQMQQDSVQAAEPVGKEAALNGLKNKENEFIAS
jgi:hypothetical protein